MALEYKIIDNALPKDAFFKIKDLLLPMGAGEFPWYFTSPIADEYDVEGGGYYFTHNFYNNLEASNWFGLVKPILDILQPNALMRVKGNLYNSTASRVTHTPHKDHDFDHKGAIFSVNTNDGATILADGTEVESVENRLLLFNPSELHSSTSCTNTLCRVNINFNYF